MQNLVPDGEWLMSAILGMGENEVEEVCSKVQNGFAVPVNFNCPGQIVISGDKDGINNGIAKNIVKYREENGKLKERKELLKVPKLGKVAYEQCAGFIRVSDGKNPLEITGVHPERSACACEIYGSRHFQTRR